MANNPIQWFPGHMAKTRRLMRECMPEVDIVLELLDARIPYSSRNPEVKTMSEGKPRVILLTKSTLADASVTKEWIEFYKKEGTPTVLVDSVSGLGIRALSDTVREVLKEKLERYRQKGMENRRIKAMIVGIPNVGKSSLINRLAGGKKAKVENRPGVTLNKQWVSTELGFDLVDMPGVLWPKFDDARVGENLAITGAIRDQILDTTEIAMVLVDRLRTHAHEAFLKRYKLTDEQIEGLDAYDLFELVGRKRGFLVSGGEVNHERTANMLLEEYRSATIGQISLERPCDVK